MARILLALVLALPLVLAPMVSARAHGGAEGCVTAIADAPAHHAGHGLTAGESGHDGEHAPEQKRVTAIPCCLTVCPGITAFTGQRASPALSVDARTRLANETAAGWAVEPAEPPPRHHS